MKDGSGTGVSGDQKVSEDVRAKAESFVEYFRLLGADDGLNDDDTHSKR